MKLNLQTMRERATELLSYFVNGHVVVGGISERGGRTKVLHYDHRQLLNSSLNRRIASIKTTTINKQTSITARFTQQNSRPISPVRTLQTLCVSLSPFLLKDSLLSAGTKTPKRQNNTFNTPRHPPPPPPCLPLTSLPTLTA